MALNLDVLVIALVIRIRVCCQFCGSLEDSWQALLMQSLQMRFGL
jgi:hypothetical protein